ncbi:MAG: RNA polymerase sigma factor [Ginsengibacter sp.]
MQNENLENEKVLLDLIAEGNESAFKELFDHYHNRTYTVAYKLTKSKVTAEEIVQDVFLKIWVGRSKLKSIDNFNGYLFIVTRNHSYKVLKSIARNYRSVPIIDLNLKRETTDVSDLLLDKEYGKLLEIAVDRLPNQQKKVYHLIKNQGLKREEVANKLELKPETVKFHLAQAMKNIRSFCMIYLESLIIQVLLISYCYLFR